MVCNYAPDHGAVLLHQRSERRLVTLVDELLQQLPVGEALCVVQGCSANILETLVSLRTAMFVILVR
jgi:hypothetical protein